MSKALKSVLLASLIVVSVLAVLTAPALATHGDTTGAVTNVADGSAIGGANVTAYNATDGSVVASTTTDANGTYALHLADGDYDLEAEATGFVTQYQNVTVVGATTVDFALEAETSSTTTTTDYGDELHNQTYDVDDSDKQVYVDVQGTNGSSVRVEFYGIDSNGTETMVHNQDLTAGPDEVASANVTVDNATYDSYRVVVYGHSQPDFLEVGTLSKLAGGGGPVDFSAKIFGVPIWGVLLALLVVAGIAGYEVHS